MCYFYRALQLFPVVRSTGIFLTFYFALTAMCLSTPSFAQPSSTGPQDVARLKQKTHFSDDFTHTNAYDLNRPVELFITIRHLVDPEFGNAEMHFTLDALGRGIEATDFDPDLVYIATLQLAREVRRLNANPRSFERGVQARITGWPATADNYGHSMMLVNELDFLKGKKVLRFHRVHPNMKTFDPPSEP
jgi:hypothetical protein